MTRGFVTVATGEKHYYEIAANLLLSYKYFSKKPLPFAIIAEEENEFTTLFDDVIIAEKVEHSFMDKLLFLKLCPYDENIFVDADSLAFTDLNIFFDQFAQATDFSALGKVYNMEDNNGAWYNVDEVGKYGKLITYKTRVHAGLMYARRTEKLKKLYEDCLKLNDEYDSFHFHMFSECKDECILSLAMPLNNMKTTSMSYNMRAVFPCLTKYKINILKGELSYSTPWHPYVKNGVWIHWGNDNTYKSLYKFNVEGLNYLSHKKNARFIDKLKFEHGVYLIVLKLKEIGSCFVILKKRIMKKIRKKN